MNKNFLKAISEIIRDIDINKIKSATKIILKKKRTIKLF